MPSQLQTLRREVLDLGWRITYHGKTTYLRQRFGDVRVQVSFATDSTFFHEYPHEDDLGDDNSDEDGDKDSNEDGVNDNNDKDEMKSDDDELLLSPMMEGKGSVEEERAEWSRFNHNVLEQNVFTGGWNSSYFVMTLTKKKESIVVQCLVYPSSHRVGRAYYSRESSTRLHTVYDHTEVASPDFLYRSYDPLNSEFRELMASILKPSVMSFLNYWRIYHYRRQTILFINAAQKILM
jgi:hypothetical protein